MNTEYKSNTLLELSATPGKYLHKLGTDLYITKTILLPSDSISAYEEVDMIPAYTVQEYESMVEQLIAEKYTIQQEIAIQRQRETKPEEFAEYNQFCEECKIKAKSLLNGKEN